MKDTPKLDALMAAMETVGCGHDLKWEVQRLKYFRDELTRLCPFQVGDRVRLMETLVIPDRLPNGNRHGWKGYDPTFVAGAMASVTKIDHWDGRFRMDLLFDRQYWVDHLGGIRENGQGDRGTFIFGVDAPFVKVPLQLDLGSGA